MAKACSGFPLSLEKCFFQKGHFFVILFLSARASCTMCSRAVIIKSEGKEDYIMADLVGWVTDILEIGFTIGAVTVNLGYLAVGSLILGIGVGFAKKIGGKR